MSGGAGAWSDLPHRLSKRGFAWSESGRTADAFITFDMPPLIDTLLYRKPGRRVLRNQLLRFCGIKPKSTVQFGSVKLADTLKIAGWLTRVPHLGRMAACPPQQKKIRQCHLQS